MRGTEQLSTTSRWRPGIVGGAWWLVRLMLVLVLAFDQLSAPFHLHGHDGIDHHESLRAHAGFDDGSVHALGEEPLLVSHAAMAIKVEPAWRAHSPPSSSIGAHVAIAVWAKFLAEIDEPQSAHWRPDRLRPDIRSHRSLPPAGRAPPPLHA